MRVYGGRGEVYRHYGAPASGRRVGGRRPGRARLPRDGRSRRRRRRRRRETSRVPDLRGSCAARELNLTWERMREGARAEEKEREREREEYERERVLYDAVLYGRGFYLIVLPPVRIRP